MYRKRSLTAAVAAVAAIAAAWGGVSSAGSGIATGSSPLGTAAAAFPATTLAFVDANTNPGSTAWMTLRGLAARFPGFAGLSAKLQGLASSTHHGVNWQRDVAPWVGDEAALGVLGITLNAGRPAPEAVLYVASRDDTKARALLAANAAALPSYQGYSEYESADHRFVAAVGNGAVLIATDTTSLASSIAARAGANQLATNPAYQALLGQLPADRFADAYVNTPELAQLGSLGVAFLKNSGKTLSFGTHTPAARVSKPAAKAGQRDSAGMGGFSMAQLRPQLARLVNGLRQLRSAGAALTATSHGVDVRIVLVHAQATTGQHGLITHTATLVQSLPAGTIAFVDAAFAPGSARQAHAGGADFGAVGAFTKATGLTPRQIATTLLSGEAAAYLNGGSALNGGLLLHANDPAAVIRILSRLAAAAHTHGLATAPKALNGGAGGLVRVHGHTVSWRRAGGLVAVGADTPGTAPTGGFAQNSAYTAALAAAGVPSHVTFLAYANVPSLIDLAQHLDTKHHISATAAANLRTVTSITAWGESTAGATTIDVFAGVS